MKPAGALLLAGIGLAGCETAPMEVRSGPQSQSPWGAAPLAGSETAMAPVAAPIAAVAPSPMVSTVPALALAATPQPPAASPSGDPDTLDLFQRICVGAPNAAAAATEARAMPALAATMTDLPGPSPVQIFQSATGPQIVTVTSGDRPGCSVTDGVVQWDLRY